MYAKITKIKIAKWGKPNKYFKKQTKTSLKCSFLLSYGLSLLLKLSRGGQNSVDSKKIKKFQILVKLPNG
jgi:hypothetical protein